MIDWYYKALNKQLHLYLLTISILFLGQACKQKDTIPNNLYNFPVAYIINTDNSISVINLKTLQKVDDIWLTSNTQFFAHHIYLSPDNQKLVVATPQYDFSLGHAGTHTVSSTQKGGYYILDANNGKILSQVDVPQINHNAVFSPDGKEIWTAGFSHSGFLYIFDASNGSLKKTLSVGTDPSEVIFSGKNAFMALGEGSQVAAVDIDKKEISRLIKVDFFPSNTWSDNDSIVYVANQNMPSINFINSKTLMAYDAIDLDFKPYQIKFNSKTNELWVCQAGENLVAIFQKKAIGWTLTKKIKTGNNAHAISFFDNQSKALVVNLSANTVRIFDTQTKELLKEITVGLKPNGVAIRE